MKRIISAFLIITIICTSLAFVPMKTEAKSFTNWYDQKLDGILVNWTKVKKAKKYEIYRLKMGKHDDYYAKKSKKKYKKIKIIKGKCKYLDKKVKKKIEYRYYIKALNKKGKTIKDTFLEIGESASKLWLGRVHGYVQTTNPKKIKFSLDTDVFFHVHGTMGGYEKKMKYFAYRKVAGSSKFKKVKLKKKGYYWVDKSVSPCKKYTYKFKSYIKYKHKKYYSKYSKLIKTASFNNKPKLKIESVTPAQVFKNQKEAYVILKIKNASKYNGTSVFRCLDHRWLDSIYVAVDTVADDNWFAWHKYNMSFVEFSHDTVAWSGIGEKGIKLPKNNPLYLKVKLSFREEDYEKSDGNIYYAGSDKSYYKSFFSHYFDMYYQGKDIFQHWSLVED